MRNIIDIAGIGTCIVGGIMVIVSNINTTIHLQTIGLWALFLGFFVLFAGLALDLRHSGNGEPQ